MFSDIVGYTRLAQANESLALELLEEHKAIMRPLFPAHGGTEIKTIGDAFLVEFKSALEAVLCAVGMQQKLREHNSRVPAPRRLELRVGIHLGDVVHTGGDVYGDAVNIASRIQPLAEPGGICFSQQVYDHIRNKTELNIIEIGEIQLKNVELPVGVYRIGLPGELGQRLRAKVTKNRIAVLPFVSLSPSQRDEYFADGMTEEVISTISKIEGIEVISRTSVMQYKKKPKPIPEVSRELEVGLVLEGSVRKAGNKLRVTVQMIDAGRDRHLWAENYDRELEDVFAIQSDIAKKIAEAFHARIPRKDSEALVGESTRDLEAYALYLRAMQLYHEGSEPSLKEAIVLYDRAVSKDPGFARAYAGLSQAWKALGGYREFMAAAEKAEAAARKALELAPDSAEAHAAMAHVHMLHDRFGEGISEGEKALQVNPNLSEVVNLLSEQYSVLGERDQALNAMKKAYELDPLSSSIGTGLARILRSSGRPDEAIDILKRVRELNPRNPRVYSGLADCYVVKKDFAKAQEILDIGLGIDPNDYWVLLGQGELYALTGRRKEAEDQLQGMMNNQTDPMQRLWGQLYIRAALGDLDEAFEALMKLAEMHSWPSQIRLIWSFEGMRKDPRFLEFCKKVGIPT